MQLVTLSDVDEVELERAVGSAAHARGRRYAQRRAVLAMRWDSSENALHGSVEGTDVYETTAYFSSNGGFAHGTCDCPVGFNCKHVVALVLTATDPARARTRSVRSPRTGVSAAPRTPAWETSLGSLVRSPQGATTNRPSGTPLAIELTLATSARPALVARLVKPGKNTWVGSGLSWTKLGSLRYYGDYVAAHVSLLQEMYALYQSRVDASRQYSYGEVKSLDLAAFESRRLWPLLDEADAVGVRLVHGKKYLGELERYDSAELCLDVTQGERSRSLEVTPAIGVDGVRLDALPIRFIGGEGHGLVYVDRADAERTRDPGDWHLRLARLTTAAPPQLQQLTLENQRLSIPGTQVSRFRNEYYPRLRHLATVISSDGAFTPPEIPDPTLVLRASYGPGHDLDVNWEWAYDIGDSRLRTPLHPDPADAGYRDLERERTILADLGFPFEQPNPSGTDAEPTAQPATGLPTLTAARATLGGIDTMRFTTEVLPQLADRPTVTVEIDGEQADYREAGDSLTIGVSADEVEGDPDWFGLGVTISVEGQHVPFTEVFLALARNDSHMLLPSGAYFSLEKPELQALRKLMEEARALQDSPGGPLKISRFQVGLWDELAALGVVERQAKAWQQQLAELRSIDTLDSTEPPDAIEARLRPYQLEGFRWLTFLWKFQLGGILADDMGLGKTLQTLALICHAKHDDPTIAPFLIVAPTSVVSNWAAEAARFTPGLKVVAISETQRRRGHTLGEVIAGADVVVTSYTLFRLEVDAYSERPWSGLVLDEAQFVKNHQSKIYQCTRTLSAPFKLAITGTPMENNLMELWSLLSITAPGLFPNPTRFEHYYARPIEKRGETELLAQFRRRIKPLVKRRSKEQVAADLPAKQEQTLEVELHPRHRKIYETHLQRERQKILGLVDDLNKNRFTIFRSLTLLRQLSLHAALIDEKHQKIPCAKVEALREHLQDVIDGGHRALIFSQFTGFLDIVRKHLDAAGVEYCYLDGKTRNRATVLKQFKNGSVPVFLISLKAGGFGLNLTEADYCFLLDPWWNPATEAQAIDRTHRIGQTRNVMVYRLIAKDTIEEKVMALKAKKAELFSSVMDDGNTFGTALDADDIRGLFS
ncbi:SWIM zinc finger protein [Amycolatopsis sulphurea]|uniref:SWIM zinc finger protein n=1 Tax=Amycolatopsis sulphurea TaxID=76022 RepID=A0A2A9FFC3_9PSEU|nr:DEAD/DEAH box helicase [Amycolatopsis sulphurea]PFG49125.1 SWIM zinc finger protein [Amycolatopsis sulphurea]